jgi:succinate dehydrogenase/fumarate reductase flavoprotein subunit
MKISRRDFIKGSLAGAAAAALSTAIPTAAFADRTGILSEDQVYEEGQYSFEIPPEKVPESEINETIDVDICIVGAGQAGTLAALTAGKLGAKTVVLQKASTVWCHGRVANMINTKFQLEEYGEPFNVYDFVSEMLTASVGRGNPKVIKLYYDNSGECGNFINDLAEEYGLEHRYIIYNDYKTSEVGWSDLSKYHRQLTFIEAMQPIAEDMGVEYRFQTPGYYLEQDETGRVTGVIAEKKAKGESGYLRVNAKKGVILCTGDIGSNPKMVAKYSDTAFGAKSCYGGAFNTGDGHKMALWVGGQMQKGAFANMIHLDPTVLPEGDAPLSDFPFLAVNLNGDRFMNEEIVYQYKVNAALSQPEHTYYQIGGKEMPDFVKSQKDIRKYTWDDAFERGAIQEGQTIEELAEKIGVPAENLRNTIQRYDEIVKNGEDVDFGKNPEHFEHTAIVEGPYYSIKRRAGILTLPGGLVTNDRLQVLDYDNNVIPGLYVAGNTVGRFYGYDYPIHGFKTIESGHSSGRAMTFGRLAAKFAMESED